LSSVHSVDMGKGVFESLQPKKNEPKSFAETIKGSQDEDSEEESIPMQLDKN